MSLYIPEGTIPLVQNAMVRIERRLPHPGEILVRVGGRVEPEDVIARAYVPADPQIINVARALGISPNQVPQAMRREPNNRVTKGEVLARASRFGGRGCHAPVNGLITAVDSETGYVTLAPEPSQYELTASIRGVVMEVQSNEGVIIETQAAEVYGAFGIGQERSGVLRLMVIDPGEVVQPEQIDPRSAYAILICGGGITAAALRRAVQEQVRGIIVGGIEERELRAFLGAGSIDCWRTGNGGWQLPLAPPHRDPGLTLVITEGFGIRPMAMPLFEMLSNLDRAEALISGTTRLRQVRRRPRVVVPLSRGVAVQEQVEPARLRSGALVRLLDAEHLGAVAQVRNVSYQPRRLPSGVRSAAVEVQLEDATPFWLPQSAVEVIA